MENITQEKYADYIKAFDGTTTGSNSNLYDHGKVEKIITQAIKKHSFLNLVTTKFVTEAKNKMLEFSLPMIGTTDTEKHERTPRNFVLSTHDFECATICLDLIVSHSDLNHYATVDFEQLFNDNLGAELAQNLTMVGFNGTHRALDSDPQANPLGEDVAKGWCAQLQEKAQVIHAADLAAQTTAQLITKALEKLPAKLRESGDLIAICGRNVLNNALINLEPKQLNAQNGVLLTAQNLIGGLRAINAPFFPANCILITTLSNLAIYLQQNTARLFFKQEPREDSLQIYFSVKLDYLLANHRHAVLIDGIEG